MRPMPTDERTTRGRRAGRGALPAVTALAASLAAAAVLTPTPAAFAQNSEAESSQSGDAASGEDESQAAAQPPSEAPFMEPLNHLATIMGSTLFLRQLCGAEKAGEWRDMMTTLLESQNPRESDRKRLIASFNEGYRAFESTYRSCTPAAREAAGRFREQGMTLARDIAARFGD